MTPVYDPYAVAELEQALERWRGRPADENLLAAAHAEAQRLGLDVRVFYAERPVWDFWEHRYVKVMTLCVEPPLEPKVWQGDQA